jgi:hypothetical protein
MIVTADPSFQSAIDAICFPGIMIGHRLISSTITTFKSISPIGKPLCAMVESSNSGFAPLHTWWRWRSCRGCGEHTSANDS